MLAFFLLAAWPCASRALDKQGSAHGGGVGGGPAPARGLAIALREGDVSGWATLGWFAYNPSYFARPDNTGRALLRYGYHAELSMLRDLVSFGVDTTFLTDRRGGLKQQFVYALAVWSFSGLAHDRTSFETSGQVASP